MNPVVIVTGTPATGKTTLARHLVSLGFGRIDVSSLVRRLRLHEGYDRSRQCYVVDTGRLVPALLERVRKAHGPVVIDSHLSHYLPPAVVSLCLVTTCSLKVLKARLDRRYSRSKVRENLDAEIFDVCFVEAREFGHRPMKFDTTQGLDRPRIARLLKEKGFGLRAARRCAKSALTGHAPAHEGRAGKPQATQTGRPASQRLQTTTKKR